MECVAIESGEGIVARALLPAKSIQEHCCPPLTCFHPQNASNQRKQYTNG